MKGLNTQGLIDPKDAELFRLQYENNRLKQLIGARKRILHQKKVVIAELLDQIQAEHPAFAQFLAKDPKPLDIPGSLKPTDIADVHSVVEREVAEASLNSTMLNQQSFVESVQEHSTGSSVTVPQGSERSKYLQMLKMGIPRPAVESRMKQVGLDPSLLETGSNGRLPKPVQELPTGSPIATPQWAERSKYLEMLKMGIPRPAVESRMKQAGLDPFLLDAAFDGNLPKIPKQVDNGRTRVKKVYIFLFVLEC
jgi:hypothetical protein